MFLNGILTIVEYREYKSINLSVLSSSFLALKFYKRGTVFFWTKSAADRHPNNDRSQIIKSLIDPSISHVCAYESLLGNAQMSLGALSPGSTSLPQGILILVWMNSGKFWVIRSSGRLVMINLNFLKWPTRAQRLSVRKSPLKSPLMSHTWGYYIHPIDLPRSPEVAQAWYHHPVWSMASRRLIWKGDQFQMTLPKGICSDRGRLCMIETDYKSTSVL